MATNFPDGVESFGVPVLGAGGAGADPVQVGNVFFVDSGSANGGDAAGYGTSKDKPFLTIDFAIGRCTASNGDVIYAMPGHSETLTAAIALDVAGVSIIGLGRESARATINVNGAVNGIAISAADCVVENILFTTGAASAVNIDINAARARVARCRFELGANMLECITVTASGDQSRIENNYFLVTANGPDQAISVEGAADNLVIRGNIFDGGSSTNTWDDAAIDFGSNTPLSVLIEDNVFLYATGTVGTGNVLLAKKGNRYHRAARPQAGIPIDIYADSSGTTTGDGSAENPTTISDAVDLAAAGDKVLLYPGTYTVTVALAADVADLTIQPVDYVPGHRKTNVEIANDTDDVNTIDVTAADVAILGIKFTKGVANTTDGTELIDVGSDYCTIRDCTFDLEARANADAINLATATKGHLIENNLFTDLATVKTAIAWASSAATIRKNDFDFSAGDAVFSEQIASPGDGNFIYDNIVTSDDTTTAVASWAAAPGEQCMVRNYLCSVGAGNVLGDDADLDPFVFANYREHGTPVGEREAINPSVS